MYGLVIVLAVVIFQVAVSVEKQDKRVLTDQQAVEIAQLVIALETNLGRPQDFEWAHEKGLHAYL